MQFPDRVVGVPVVVQQEMSPESCPVTTDWAESRNKLCGIQPCSRHSLCRVHVESKSEKTNGTVMWTKAETWVNQRRC